MNNGLLFARLFNMLTSSQDMLTAARAALRHAYCPYSQFPVGACVQSEDGRLFSAANVENAAYAVGTCAETNAISQMVNHGYRHITAILIVSDSATPAFPCGACRQYLNEFAEPTTPVFISNNLGEIQEYTAGDLLPRAFGPHNLEKS